MSVQTLSSGSSTPTSSTLSCSTSPVIKGVSYAIQETAPKATQISASQVIELIASRSALSNTVFVYDLAEQVGFGALTKSWSGSDNDTVPVVSLQTRPGAGRSLVGRLSEAASKASSKGGVLTAYTTPTGLAVMANTLSCVPLATQTGRLIIQVPRVTFLGQTFALSPSLSPLATSLPMLSERFTILFSVTPQESVDLAALCYNLNKSHIIHVFDHYSSTRELGHSVVPTLISSDFNNLPVSEAIKLAGYSSFDYSGDEQAHTVIVLLNGPLAQSAKAFATEVSKLGVVVVRVYRPWDESAFRAVLPPTVQTVHVLDDVPNTVTRGPLHIDVIGSLLDLGLSIYPHGILPAQAQDFLACPSSFHKFVFDSTHISPESLPSAQSTELKKLLFFSTPRSSLSHTPQLIQEAFLLRHGMSATLLTNYDILSKKGGIVSDRILLSPPKDKLSGATAALLPLATTSQGESDFLGILDPSLLKSHSLLTLVKVGSPVLVATSWSGAELSSSLPQDTLLLILNKKLRVYCIDTEAIAAKLVAIEGKAREAVENLVLYHAFLRLFIGSSATEVVVRQAAQATCEAIVQDIQRVKIGAHAWASLFEVDFSSCSVDEDSAPSNLRNFESNAVSIDAQRGDDLSCVPYVGSWHDAAKHILFPDVFSPIIASDSTHIEEYSQIPGLRPDAEERTYLITCTVNRRLTPLDYDRNVFHVEFDTSGTGLKYAIGEALGVHGWNDEQDILDFCTWYGVDPNLLITIPVAASEEKMHARTVFQALHQEIDLFGRPPKSFYTELAPYATDRIQQLALMFIGSAEGSAMFKKLAEKDTVTFADVLQLYPSARPPLETLCMLIGNIKPRHYSIASAQSVVGDRVDLLVVTVDWVTPSGSKRYGQCTRYLAGLRPGQKVTVSIKPSVMKLPPDDMQPIIMAGLGTGAAPFRAFLQHRAWLAAQSIPVGATYYYFGSRHQSQEYLYGEEIEAYILEGVITRAGLAFSRDGPRKVYIQHKMAQDAKELVRMLSNEKGVFYLCGPTWPVPDVYAALVGALVKHNGLDSESAAAHLEQWKEEERYVLEVY